MLPSAMARPGVRLVSLLAVAAPPSWRPFGAAAGERRRCFSDRTDSRGEAGRSASRGSGAGLRGYCW